MPGERGDERSGDAPRTDLPVEREPYYEGYFGTDEEEGVEREREAGDADREERDAPRGGRGAAEDAAGGDREIT
jgi:hypothetical protein